MAWTHAAWDTEPTDAAKAAKLRLHMAEVALEIGPDVGSGSMSLSTGELRQYRLELQEQLDRLDARLRTSPTRSGIARARF